MARPGGSSIANQGLGHVVEITEGGGDQAGTSFTWELVLLCGEPGTGTSVAQATQPAVINQIPNGSVWYGGHWDGNVFKPKSFRRPRKPH